MAVKTESNGQIVPKTQARPTLAARLQSMSGQIKLALPKHISPERITRISLTALRQNPRLGECDEASFLGSVLSAAQLGLEVNSKLGHAWLIPYKNECTLQIGYQGFMDLARRSGVVEFLPPRSVREGDEFQVEHGLREDLKHIPSSDPNREEKKITHVYAVAKIKNADPVFFYMTAAQVEKIRARSPSRNSGPWVTDWEAMAWKTVIKQLCKWLPRSAELAQAEHVDDTPKAEWSQEVTEVLESQGLTIDHETGEVLEEGSGND